MRLVMVLAACLASGVEAATVNYAVMGLDPQTRATGPGVVDAQLDLPMARGAFAAGDLPRDVLALRAQAETDPDFASTPLGTARADVQADLALTNPGAASMRVDLAASLEGVVEVRRFDATANLCIAAGPQDFELDLVDVGRSELSRALAFSVDLAPFETARLDFGLSAEVEALALPGVGPESSGTGSLALRIMGVQAGLAGGGPGPGSDPVEVPLHAPLPASLALLGGALGVLRLWHAARRSA